MLSFFIVQRKLPAVLAVPSKLFGGPIGPAGGYDYIIKMTDYKIGHFSAYIL